MANNDIKGATVADTVYCKNSLVAKDVECTLPGIEFATVDIQAMGTMSVPIIGMLNNMQLTVKKIGYDEGFTKINMLESQDFEFRWVQQKVKDDGRVTEEGCKAFVRTLPAAIPDQAIAPGSATELESTYAVSRTQLYVDGKEVYCVDRLNSVLRWGGKDYYEKLKSLL